MRTCTSPSFSFISRQVKAFNLPPMRRFWPIFLGSWTTSRLHSSSEETGRIPLQNWQPRSFRASSRPTSEHQKVPPPYRTLFWFQMSWLGQFLLRTFGMFRGDLIAPSVSSSPVRTKPFQFSSCGPFHPLEELSRLRFLGPISLSKMDPSTS